jgi:hypothetical protein
MHDLMKTLKVKALVDKLPGWVLVGGVTLGTAVWGAFQSNLTDLLKDATSGQFSLIWPIVWHALAVGFVAEANYIATDPWAKQVQAAGNATTPPSKLPPLGTNLFMLALLLILTGCLSSAPVVPITPANKAQTDSCESTATFHDGVVIGDFVFTGTATTLGTVAALEPASNDGLRTGLAVGAAVAGGAAAIGVGLAELTASNFTNSHCSEVVGALPMKPKGGN